MTLVQTLTHRTDPDLLAAGAYALGVTGLCLGAGVGLGAAAGNVGVGLAVGAVVGIPASIAAVILRYRKGR